MSEAERGQSGGKMGGASNLSVHPSTHTHKHKPVMLSMSWIATRHTLTHNTNAPKNEFVQLIQIHATYRHTYMYTYVYIHTDRVEHVMDSNKATKDEFVELIEIRLKLRSKSHCLPQHTHTHDTQERAPEAAKAKKGA